MASQPMTTPTCCYRLLSLRYTLLATRRNGLEAAIDEVTRQMEETRAEMERVRELCKQNQRVLKTDPENV